MQYNFENRKVTLKISIWFFNYLRILRKVLPLRIGYFYFIIIIPYLIEIIGTPLIANSIKFSEGENSLRLADDSSIIC